MRKIIVDVFIICQDTSLHSAISDGSVETVRQLLAVGAHGFVNAKDKVSIYIFVSYVAFKQYLQLRV